MRMWQPCPLLMHMCIDAMKVAAAVLTTSIARTHLNSFSEVQP